MGAGVAKEANDKFKDLDLILGTKVSRYGNHVHVVDYEFSTIIFSFPTKYHYKDNSNINLIEQSTKQLLTKVNYLDFNRVYLPKVGCGLGSLDWNEVKPLLERYLDDRFIVVSIK